MTATLERPPGAIWPDGPFRFDIEPGLPLLILSCSERKRPTRSHEFVRFIELYDGPTWQQVRASGYPATNVAAISAMGGFLEPGWPIQTYDKKMDEDSAHWFVRFSDHTYRLAKCVEKAGSAFVVGGLLYQSIARAAELQRPSIVPRMSYASGSYLAQRAQLGEWLRKNARIEGDIRANPATVANL